MINIIKRRFNKKTLRILTGNPKGMTLIEIMVVLGIIAMIIGMAMPRLSNRNYQLKSTVRKFTVLSRELHNYAKLRQTTYRLVLSMTPADETPDGEPLYEYWVESTTKNIALPSEDREEQEAEEDEDGNPIDPNGFTMDNKIFKSKQALPSGMRFESVELAVGDEVIDRGLAYIHFSPQGLVEESAIHITYGDSIHWTMAIHPLTGRAEVVSRDISLKEIRSQ